MQIPELHDWHRTWATAIVELLGYVTIGILASGIMTTVISGGSLLERGSLLLGISVLLIGTLATVTVTLVFSAIKSTLQLLLDISTMLGEKDADAE